MPRVFIYKVLAASDIDRLALSRSMRSRHFPLLLVSLAVLTAAMLSPIKFAVNAGFWDALMDATHVPIFAGLTWLLWYTDPWGRQSPVARVAVAAALALAIAVLMEVLQSFTGRTASAHDVLLGAFGISAASTFLLGWRWLGALGGAGLLAMALQPATREAQAILWRTQHFPLLGDFESNAEVGLWVPAEWCTRQRVRLHATSGSYSLQVQMHRGGYPGVRLLCADANWSEESQLVFDVFNEGASFPITVRIDDARSSTQADRFTKVLQVASGASTLRLPLDEVKRGVGARALDLGRVRRVLLFADHPDAEHVIYLDHIRLE